LSVSHIKDPTEFLCKNLRGEDASDMGSPAKKPAAEKAKKAPENHRIPDGVGTNGFLHKCHKLS